MNEIIPGLWIGDFRDALNYQELKQHNISAIVSVMRGNLSIHQSFTHIQIEVDDTEDEDIMKHFLSCIHFIRGQLDKRRGVLVHCQAGVSRSTAIVAAYLICTRNINPDEALDIIKRVRTIAEPNAKFLRQLDLFRKAKCNVSATDKEVRKFYLDRTAKDATNGNGFHLETEMMSNFPNLSGSASAIKTQSCRLRRQIRCKMCRQELATRKHIVDHGQLPPETELSTTMNSLPSVQNSTSGATDPDSGLGSKTRDDEASNSSQNDTIITEPTLPAVPNALQSNESQGKSSSPHEASHSSEEAQRPLLDANQDQEIATGLQLLRPSSTPNNFPNPPLLIDPKCSGYFIEPMKWMSHFLSAGQLSGKITCPNKRCGAKLGNYDWAGVCCGCKEWVTPSFCVNRSKVDEVVM